MNIRKSIPKTVHAMVCAFSEIRKADVIPPIWWCRSVCLTLFCVFPCLIETCAKCTVCRLKVVTTYLLSCTLRMSLFDNIMRKLSDYRLVLEKMCCQHTTPTAVLSRRV